MGINRDKIKEENQNKGQGFTAKFPEYSYYPEVGDNKVYVLPNVENPEDYRKEIFTHKSNTGLPILCIKMHGDKPCFICEKAKELYFSGNPEDEAISRTKLYRRPKSFINIVDVKTGNNRVLFANNKIDDEGIRKIILNMEYPDITDKVEGRYLTITRIKAQKKGDWDKFSINIAINPSPLKDYDKFMAGRYKIRDVIKDFVQILTYEQMKAVFEGKTTEEVVGETLGDGIEAVDTAVENVETSESEATEVVEDAEIEAPPCYNLGKRNNAKTVCKNCSYSNSDCDGGVIEESENIIEEPVATKTVKKTVTKKVETTKKKVVKEPEFVEETTGDEDEDILNQLKGLGID